MKRITAIMIVFALLLTVAACGKSETAEVDESNKDNEATTPVISEEVETDGENLPLWETSDMDDGTVYIYKYNGSKSNIAIPDSIGGKTVSGIYGDAFFENSIIETVTFPNTIKAISKRAFWKCTNLKTVDFSDSIVYIGDYAFAYCSSLKEITLPPNIESLGVTAFSDCSSLERVVFLGNKLKTIPKHCFENTAIHEITFPSGTERIELSILTGEDAIIFVPETVGYIHEGAFPGGEGIVIHGKLGSYAEQFAKENNYKFVADY